MWSIFKSLIACLETQSFLIFQIIFEDDDQEKKMLEKENEDFKQEVSRLYDMILHLENSLKLSEKENKKLGKLMSY